MSMKKTFKNIISVVLVLLLSVMFSLVSFAADASKVLTYEVSTDGYAVVADCNENAKGIVEIPASVVIGKKTYSVKYIGEKAFDNCSYVTDIIIPEGVTAIRNFAFRDCISLENVYIPESLAICQYDAFDGCGKMTIYCYEVNYQFFSIYGLVSNTEVIVLDEGTGDENESATKQEEDFITRFFNALKQMIEALIANFKSEDSFDISDIPFLEDVPFLDELPIDI